MYNLREYEHAAGPVHGMLASELYDILQTRLNDGKNQRDGLRGTVFSYSVESVKAQFPSFLRGHETDGFPLLIIRQDETNVNTAYLGFKNGLADFFVAFHQSHSQEAIIGFTRALRSKLGERYAVLTGFVPEASLYQEEFETQSDNPPEIEKQIFLLIRDLFGFLAAYFGRPVLLFTEDLHWMDGPGMGLLKHLLESTTTSEFYWIGSYSANHEWAGVLRSLEDFSQQGIPFERVHLHPAPQPEISSMIRQIWKAEPSAEFIEMCAELCGSDPTGLEELLQRLKTARLVEVRDNALHWDRDAIENLVRSRQQDNLRERWDEFSPPLRNFLVLAAACRFDEKILAGTIGNSGKDFDRLLDEAMRNDLVRRTGRTLTFATPELGDNILKLVTPEARSAAHYAVAKVLDGRDRDTLAEPLQLFMTDQFNESLDLVRSQGEQARCAELNYTAGNIAWKDGDRVRARHYYTVCASLLKELPWREVAGPLTDAHVKLARLEYESGDYDLAEHNVDFLLDRIDDAIKRASLFELKVVINNRLGRYRKSVLILKEGLAELGLDMPLSDDAVDAGIRSLQRSLDTQTTKGISSTEERARFKAIRKLLFVGGMSMHHASSALMSWGALQMIRWSANDHEAPEEAIGWVVFGRVKITQDDIDTGYQFGLKAIEINQAMNDISLRCRVFGIFSFFILPWKLPAGESDRFLREAYEAGRTSGDLIGAYVIRTHQLNLHLLGGRPLSGIQEMHFEESDPAHELTYYITHYQKNLVRFLVEESTLFSIPHLQPSWLAGLNTIQEEKFYRNFVWSRYYFMFGYYHLAARAAKEANANRKLQEGSLLVPANYLVWFVSISQNWQNYTAEERSGHLPFLREVLNRFHIWADHCPDNFGSCYLLLKAEHHRLHGESDDAFACYRKSLELAEDNLWHRALAAECCFKFIAGTFGHSAEAVSYLTTAIESYTAWGATAKVKHLSRQFSAFCPPGIALTSRFNIELIQQELSGDLQVESIVKKILVLCARISGSTAAVLFSVEGSADMRMLGQYELFLRPDRRHNGVYIRQQEQRQLTQAVRAQQHILVNGWEGGTRPNGINNKNTGIRSYLILPVTIRDHLSFVLYLENDVTRHRYTSEVVKWVRITLNQGALTIENARIHELTLRLNAEVREKMEEKERLMDEMHRQRDEYLRSLEFTQNEDRKRIASDLHDSVGSMLSSVRMRLNSLQNEVEQALPARSKRFGETLNLVDETVQELRRIVYNMLPVSLSRFGLKETLQTFINQVRENGNLNVELQVLGLEERLPDGLEMAVYRVCQELVQNVMKHAGATTLRIQLIRRNDVINLIVEDNGRGMNPENVVKGIGFNTIENKVQLYGGRFTIESTPERGTMILIDIPESRAPNP